MHGSASGSWLIPRADSVTCSGSGKNKRPSILAFLCSKARSKGTPALEAWTLSLRGRGALTCWHRSLVGRICPT